LLTKLSIYRLPTYCGSKWRASRSHGPDQESAGQAEAERGRDAEENRQAQGHADHDQHLTDGTTSSVGFGSDPIDKASVISGKEKIKPIKKTSQRWTYKIQAGVHASAQDRG
jgi:hypothetical protein